MSGIAGIYFKDGRTAEPGFLELMTNTLAHRGPDDKGIWCGGPLGFGHSMLWTTQESLNEKLPFMDKTTGIAITSDARIDNREELISVLRCGDKNITDSELILRAYEKWGEHCPENLLGDFSFAIWDSQKQMLFCARDHIGVKPFYYYKSDRIFVFASEIKAIFRAPGVPRQLNETRIGDYLMPVLEDKVVTFYKDIFRLPPAHAITVTKQGVSIRRYWSLNPELTIRYDSDEEYAKRFREIFTESMRCRLRSAYKTGSMLSGGLDSSSIVCVARQLLCDCGAQPLNTFSAIFDDVPECDERQYIKSVLAQNSLKPHYVTADRISPLAEIENILRHQDEPFYTPNLFIHRGLYGSANKEGVRVLLDGIDGDTTVSHGLPFLCELARKGEFYRLFREARSISKNFNRPFRKVISRYVISPLIPQSLRLVRRFIRRNSISSFDKGSIIKRSFARRIRLEERYNILMKERLTPPMTVKKEHFHRLTSGIIPFALEVADKASAGFSIEPRYPFFDKRLIEFCFALPPEQKLCNGFTRVVMRRAMAGIMPNDVCWRGGKSNLSACFNRGLLKFEQQVIENEIFDDSNAVYQFVDIDKLRAIYQKYVLYKRNEDALNVWKGVTLSLWLKESSIN
ncbi:MAG: lasso peptide isopeptide bond-forming cyclase [Candidatus Omnitrophica bacterium]|nr:lasso peptide isopeptide bond-forming cyclase [Candidatus Omnitrophota bacterium]